MNPAEQTGKLPKAELDKDIVINRENLPTAGLGFRHEALMPMTDLLKSLMKTGALSQEQLQAAMNKAAHVFSYARSSSDTVERNIARANTESVLMVMALELADGDIDEAHALLGHQTALDNPEAFSLSLDETIDNLAQTRTPLRRKQG